MVIVIIILIINHVYMHRSQLNVLGVIIKSHKLDSNIIIRPTAGRGTIRWPSLITSIGIYVMYWQHCGNIASDKIENISGHCQSTPFIFSQTLVEFGLDVTLPNDEGHSPCYTADVANQRQCTRYLMVVEACRTLAERAIQLHTRLKRCQKEQERYWQQMFKLITNIVVLQVSFGDNATNY
jgi:hypothetical protein